MLFGWYVLAEHAVHTKSEVCVCTCDTINPAVHVEMVLHSRSVAAANAFDSHCVAKLQTVAVLHSRFEVAVSCFVMYSSVAEQIFAFSHVVNWWLDED